MLASNVLIMYSVVAKTTMMFAKRSRRVTLIAIVSRFRAFDLDVKRERGDNR